MTSDRIPPRPWRAKRTLTEAWLLTDDGREIARCYEHETAELICRLVNAEPSVIAALEAAEEALAYWCETTAPIGVTADEATDLIRAALARLKP